MFPLAFADTGTKLRAGELQLVRCWLRAGDFSSAKATCWGDRCSVLLEEEEAPPLIMCFRLGVRLGSRMSAAGSGKLVLSEWINQSKSPRRLTGWCTAKTDDDVVVVAAAGPATASVTVDSNPALFPLDVSGSDALVPGTAKLWWYPDKP